MARSESFQCDICGKVKNDKEMWWMAWVDCFSGSGSSPDQPLFKLTRWSKEQAQSEGVKHLCGARCSETMIDRWISDQRERPEAHCEP